MNKDEIRGTYPDEAVQGGTAMHQAVEAVEAALAADREAALRDVFATAALGAFLCAPGHYAANDPTSVAQRAYHYADAMVEERKHRR